tara:strand:+ start:440 stop:748 length:309 start_codon:yes stop_codon:yes gene_type:complete
MVRAYLLSWGEKGRSLIALFLFAISQIRPGWQPWAVSQNKQASKHNDSPICLLAFKIGESLCLLVWDKLYRMYIDQAFFRFAPFYTLIEGLVHPRSRNELFY